MIIKRGKEIFTEQLRQEIQTEIFGDRKLTKAELKSIYGKHVWTPTEFCKQFAITRFAPPLAIVRRISDRKEGTVYYQGQPPQFYFDKFIPIDGEPEK